MEGLQEPGPPRQQVLLAGLLEQERPLPVQATPGQRARGRLSGEQAGANSQRDTWIELGCNVVLPTIVLVFLSKEDRLGPGLSLALGLAFPLGHAGWSRWRGDAISPLTVLSVVGVLLTGGIGLLQLDARWFAAKEAVLPLVSAAIIWLSRSTPWPVVETLLFRILDRDKVAEGLASRGHAPELAPLLGRVEAWFLGSFVYASVSSLVLARYLVNSPAGTASFNEELGWFTGLSFPVVVLPMTVLMGWAINGLLNELEAITGREIDDLLRPGLANKK